jgi:polysaccharide chain length determinant protein (PEP-CTERM system associated)
MVEDFEEKPAESLNLEQYWGLARRRYWYFLAPLFLAWSLVWGASWFLPSVYKSATLILVEQPTMPKDYVVPNVTDDLQERVQSITQQILSRTRLLHIIDELNLYTDERSRRSPDELVERMRKDISIDLVHDERRSEVTAFEVSYLSRDPRVAQRVTSELTNLFISENLEVRQQASQDTTNFLESRLEEARKTLAEQEEKVREFKVRHPGDLPTQLGSNLQILSGLQSQLQTEEDALNAAKQQNVYLQSLLNQYRTVQKTSKTGAGAPVGLPAINDELDKLKAQLADLSSHYTDRHPDVRKLKDQIARTEKMRDQIIADLKTGAKARTDDSSDTAPQTEADIRDSSPMFQLQSQLRANQIEINNREHSIAELKKKIDSYQGHLSQEPVTEQQLTDLSRGYEQSKANYDDLLKKKNASEMATSMELRQQGEHFRVLDPPSLPSKPAFPNHLKFCEIGLGVGLVLGGGLAGSTEFLDDRLHSEKALKELLPVAVISELPSFTTPDEEKTERRKLWAIWATAALVLVTILGGFAYSFLRG